ncbi:protein of unknown function DUF1802 [Isosphaera pallida ATCC 43644]|uniref:DUF1802 family protein n=1 Tax=Isosphaera pallida (strain ATCC 43644 / DSM 9630 / IS1B) TaxID=575540 RepID=E8R2D8_ISOPI|nr:DUF1802 family protein [Isosphaera pallida]ADV61423.1 protein of unknown function DUF1802 [Isosphaera pallida ATCC 43644]
MNPVSASSSPPHANTPWSPPERPAAALKEWSGVVEALGSGRQIILIRAGGLHERRGPGRFQVEQPAFWLWPTRLHQDQQGLKPEAIPPIRPETTINTPPRLEIVAVVAWETRVESLELLERLDPLHVWTPETIRLRFTQRRPGVHLLALRVWRCEPVDPPPGTDASGCSSWVEWPDPLAGPLALARAPALPTDHFQAQLDQLARLLERPAE